MAISREEAAGGWKMNEREVDLLECGATPHILHSVLLNRKQSMSTGTVQTAKEYKIGRIVQFISTIKCKHFSVKQRCNL